MTTEDGPIRLATRGSDLALRQATTIKQSLQRRRRPVELVEIQTTGDRIDDELIHRLGKTGAFVRALDEEVLAGEVDAAVHSMKDMPTEMPDELIVAGVPERASAGDVLLTPGGTPFSALGEGATVGTSSLRRRAELLDARSDLDVQPLRGNIDTRIEKLLAPHRQREHERRLDAAGDVDDDDNEATDDADDSEEREHNSFDRTPEEWFDGLHEIERRALERDPDTEFDGIVLAAAGLERAGLARHVSTEKLPTEQFVPAPGQGAIAVTALDDAMGEQIHDSLDHPRTRVETTVERVVLGELGGGCIAPMGAHAVLRGEHVHVVVRVLDRDGEHEVRATRDLPVADHPTVARDLAADLAEQGAADLIEAAREDTDTAGEREAKRAE